MDPPGNTNPAPRGRWVRAFKDFLIWSPCLWPQAALGKVDSLFWFCNETDTEAEAAGLVVVRADIAAIEEHVVRAAAVVSSRGPIEAAVADNGDIGTIAAARSGKANGSGSFHCRPFYDCFFTIFDNIILVLPCVSDAILTPLPIVRKQNYTIRFTTDGNTIFVFAWTIICSIIIVLIELFSREYIKISTNGQIIPHNSDHINVSSLRIV